MIFDTDDLYEGHDRLDLLHALKDANQLFRCTAFAVPALGSDAYWASLPEWIELAVHGWLHGDPPTDGGECRAWSAQRMRECIEARPSRFAQGFKAPGWKISDGCYEALAEAGWWIADHWENDARRPRGLRVHRLGDGDHVHTHIGNVCGNGIEETFDELVAVVTAASSFELISEMVQPWA